MLWVTTQPDHIEFIWETMVQERNFAELGIDLSTVYCVFGIKQSPSMDLINLIHNSKMNIIMYEDTRSNWKYSPAIQFHLLKKFYKQYKPEYVFHIDSDVILQRVPAFTGMLDGEWHVGDANSYLGWDYLQFFPSFLQGVQEMFGISPEFIKSNELISGGTGGANYLMCGIDETFWEEVEEMSCIIYERWYDEKGGPKIPKNYQTGDDLQIWTAGMWAWIWCAWKRGIVTNVNPELAYCMSDHRTDCFHHNFFHNTGSSIEGLFNKRDYSWTYPFEHYLSCDFQYAQHNYIALINRIKNDLDKEVTVIVHGTNPELHSLNCDLLVIGYSVTNKYIKLESYRPTMIKSWWIIESTTCPTEEQFQHLLSIRKYNQVVTWDNFVIKRKLL